MFFDHVMQAAEPIEDKNQPALSRRAFLHASAAAGGGFLMGIALPAPGHAAAAESFAPNAFIRIAPHGEITLIMPQIEMGQGTYTSMSMLIAEELEIGLDQMRYEHAPASDKLYTNPALGFQVTGGSTSVRGFYVPLRQAGAAARMMLIAAAADAWHVDPATCKASRAVVSDASGKRHLTYGALAEKAAQQPVPTDIPLKPAKDFKLIGTPAKRIDVAGKVNGTATYGIDTKLPGMKIATVAASPVFGGKLASVDDSAAKAVKGVRQIVRIEDAVAVVADHMGAAKKGLDALKITWDEGANAHASQADIVGALEAASHREGAIGKKEGDIDAGMKGAAKVVEAIYQLPFLAHAAMEPLNCTVHVRKDACDIWVGTQVASRAQATAAEVTGLPLEAVNVHNHLLGGGFGRRLDIDSITQAVQLAKQVDGPVKIIWTREEDIQHDVYRPYYYDRLRAGLDASGHPVAFHHRVAGSSIVARWIPPLFKNDLDFDAVEAAAGPYDFPNLLIDYVRQEPPAGMTTGWWRGVGVTHNAFMVEGFIDELAVASGKDPVEYRRTLLGKSPRAKAVLDLVAEKAGWGKTMPAGSGRGVALLLGFGTYLAQVAEVSVGKDGQPRVTRVVCALDCGVVVNPDTVKAQVEGGIMFGLAAALYGEITVKDGRVEQSNFDSYQVLRINEAPAIEVHIVNSQEKPGGMGEPATSALGSAVVNAIHAATGKRLRRLPINADELKGA